MNAPSKFGNHVRIPFITLSKIKKMNSKTRIGIILLLTMGATAVVEPVINKIRLGDQLPTTMGLYPISANPSWQIPFGSDIYGRDLFGMTLMGLRFTLMIGLIAAAVELAIAIVLGSLAGYKGGIIDDVLRTITDFMIVVPTWPLLVLISAFIPKIDLIGLSLVIAVLGWPQLTRAFRSQVLSLSQKPHVDLAKASGLGSIEIIFLEILPSMLPYIGVGFANTALAAMISETAIRFLGVGPVGLPTLGYLINFMLIGQGSGYITKRPHLLAPPVSFLVLSFFSLHLINIGLDETYNPRLRKITGE